LFFFLKSDKTTHPAEVAVLRDLYLRRDSLKG
jgi:hypothetical protein